MTAYLGCVCGKRYDTSGRAAGSRVSCPACGAVLVVPAPRASAGAITASERLRKARGEPCAWHPHTLADRKCEECRRFMCEACRAPRPATHLCRTCGQSLEATKAMPLDFGLFSTPLVAVQVAATSFGRVLTFNMTANLVKWVISIALFVPTVVILRGLAPANQPLGPNEIHPTAPQVFVLVVGFGLIFLTWLFFDLIYTPAVNLILLDAALRKTRLPFVQDLKTAARRAAGRAWSLFVTLLLLLLVLLATGIVLLPFVLLFLLTEMREILVVGVVVFTLAVGASIIGIFGLALPAVVLEHRTAVQAFERAWTLARLRLWESAMLGAGVIITGVVLSSLLGLIGSGVRAAFDNDGVGQVLGTLIPGLGTVFLDVAWSAVLVVAYHGLVAEEAQVPGRRSALK